MGATLESTFEKRLIEQLTRGNFSMDVSSGSKDGEGFVA